MTDPKFAPHDFLNPFMAASILTAKGQRIPLGTNTTNPTGGDIVTPAQIKSEFSPLPTSLPFVSEIQVTTNLGRFPVIALTLTPPYNDAINILDSPLIEWGRTLIEVQIGYVFGTTNLVLQSPVYRGVTTKPEVQLGADVVIKLNAHGVGAFSMVRQKCGRIVNGSSRKDLIKLLVDANQEGDPTGTSNPSNKVFTLDKNTLDFALNVEKNPNTARRLNEKIAFSQGHRSDFQALLDLCLESLCWPSFIGNKLFIIPRGTLAEAPQFVLSMFHFPNGQVGPDTGVWPILGASSPNMEVYLPFSQFGLRSRNIDSQSPSKAPHPERTDKLHDDKTTGQDSLGGGTKNTTSLNRSCGEEAAIADTNNPREAARIDAEYEKSRVKMGVNLELDTLGIPDIVPGSVVNVRGLGIRLSGEELGNYAVKQVTHTFNNSGFITSLSCWSNSSALDRSHAEKVAKLNKKKAKDVSPQEGGKIKTEPKKSVEK